MISVTIGYPVGLQEDYFMIEQANDTKKLKEEEVSLWAQLSGIREIEVDGEAGEVLKQLEYNGLMITGESLDALYKKISSCVVVRQGAASIHEGKPAIFLHTSAIFPSELQQDMWRLSNGRRSLGSIRNLLTSKHQLTTEEFFEVFASLFNSHLLFLM